MLSAISSKHKTAHSKHFGADCFIYLKGKPITELPTKPYTYQPILTVVETRQSDTT